MVETGKVGSGSREGYTPAGKSKRPVDLESLTRVAQKDCPRERVQREKIVGSVHSVSRTSSGIHLRAIERRTYFILAWCTN